MTMTRMTRLALSGQRRLKFRHFRSVTSAATSLSSAQPLFRHHHQQGGDSSSWLTASAVAAASLGLATLGLWHEKKGTQCEANPMLNPGSNASTGTETTTTPMATSAGLLGEDSLASTVLNGAGSSNFLLKRRSGQRRSTKFQVLKGLEVKEEGEKIRLAKFVRELHELAQEQQKEVQERSLVQLVRRCSTATLLRETLSVHGMNLNRLTQSEAHRLVQGLQREELLDKESLTMLIEQAIDVLKKEDTLIDLRSTKSNHKQVIVVGDLHGSLKCLRRVSDIVGDMGDPEKVVVFAGDFVDRGENSLEVFFTLLLYKLVYPKNVILLRGNHEDSMIASVYGFCDEIRDKYGPRRGANIFKSMSDLFAALPVCAVTDTSFIVHGGLPSDNFSLSQVAEITPDERCKLHTVMESRNEHEKLLEGLIWSDPSDFDGVAENARGCGIEFGPDVVKDFLDRHNLQYIVRGHEPAEMGTQVMHCDDDKAVITVFSTANYPNGEGDNLGAVVSLDQEGNASAIDFHYDGSINQEDPEKVLQSILIEKRNELVSAFSAIQQQSNGTVTPQQWSQVMNDTLQIPDIPWADLQSRLAPTTAPNAIDWRHHLDRVAPCVSNALDGDQVTILSSNPEQVKNMFQLFDADGSGSIDRQEFYLGIEMLNKRLLPSDKQITDHDALFDALDLDGNGEIDIAELNQGMAQSAAFTSISSSLDDKQVSNLKEHSEMLLVVFKFLDTDGSGSIDRCEFRTGINLLNKRLPKGSQFDDADKLFDALDSDGSGDIDITEFNQVFSQLK
ncbi:Phytochrome-associated serine/threonine-protein phosphatase [Seminavis robusta]|uniref:Serine/threonine-protein phosphatase n=1 Tax=Seminavis robusta TaxID=568900 RepID=A0A9N8HDU1_9STRA|nr:Phytochrome-associated serine/threonine-protein phosphatase [Seminavis robusta]|eukprot:Sro442_g143850.1 Phytochrome-associated serine/threonine-protein phosphatase (787) ;mRNA; f:17567-20345